MDKSDLRNILLDLKEEIEKVIGKKLVNLILFGSYARGDFSKDSDIDLLLVVKDKLTLEEKEKISLISSRFSLEYDTVIVWIDYPFKEFKTRKTPLLLNIRKEGIKI